MNVSDQRATTLGFLKIQFGGADRITSLAAFSSHCLQGADAAFVPRPPGFDPQEKYPLILEIHGGPNTAYGPHFSAEVQLFAAAGYVVVYANPRGSTSYGEEFAQTIHHNYPSEDYDDLIDVVDGVIAQGSINPAPSV